MAPEHPGMFRPLRGRPIISGDLEKKMRLEQILYTQILKFLDLSRIFSLTIVKSFSSHLGILFLFPDIRDISCGVSIILSYNSW